MCHVCVCIFLQAYCVVNHLLISSQDPRSREISQKKHQESV